MKKQNKSNVFILFFECLLITFFGRVICRILAVAVNCIFDCDDSFLIRIVGLPYGVYFVFSLAISLILTLFIYKKTK